MIIKQWRLFLVLRTSFLVQRILAISSSSNNKRSLIKVFVLDLKYVFIEHGFISCPFLCLCVCVFAVVLRVVVGVVACSWNPFAYPWSPGKSLATANSSGWSMSNVCLMSSKGPLFHYVFSINLFLLGLSSLSQMIFTTFELVLVRISSNLHGKDCWLFFAFLVH